MERAGVRWVHVAEMPNGAVEHAADAGFEHASPGDIDDRRKYGKFASNGAGYPVQRRSNPTCCASRDTSQKFGIQPRPNAAQAASSLGSIAGSHPRLPAHGIVNW